MSSEIYTAAEMCTDLPCINWCCCGDCEYDYGKRAKICIAVLLGILTGALWISWGVLYTQNIAPFTKLQYTVESNQQLDQHTCTTSDGSTVQCYDGIISGTYPYSSQIVTCHMTVVHNVYLPSTALSQMQQQYPVGLQPPTWSKTPSVAETCTFTLNSPTPILVAAIVFSVLLFLFLLSQWVLWCRSKRAKVRRTVYELGNMRPARSKRYDYGVAR
jgi:hypothetical protein